MGKWVEVRLLPEQYDLQDAILEHFQDVRHPTPRSMETGMRFNVPLREGAAEFLNGLGIQYKEIEAGRPSRYPARKRTSVEISPEVWDEIEKRRGIESRAVFIEQAIRMALGMPPLKPID